MSSRGGQKGKLTGKSAKDRRPFVDRSVDNATSSPGLRGLRARLFPKAGVRRNSCNLTPSKTLEKGLDEKIMTFVKKALAAHRIKP
jgi:hypothetical protein